MCTTLISCSSISEDDVIIAPEKGAKTELMQSIAYYMDEIQSVEKDTSYQIAEGLNITDAHFTYLTRPIRMFVATIDLTKQLSVVTCTPNNENKQDQPQTIPEQMLYAEKAGKKVLMGVNGDFAGKYNDKYKFFTMNIFVKDAQVLKDTYHDDYEGLYVVLKSGDVKIIHPKDFHEIRDDVVEAMGGYQSLVKDGEVNHNLAVDNITMNFDPRTFMGLSEDNKKCYLFVIDGRQKGYSSGMRLKDVAKLCKGSGCYQAMNLDGGGSSTFVVKNKKGDFEVLNKPSDGETRPVINGLIVIKK